MISILRTKFLKYVYEIDSQDLFLFNKIILTSIIAKLLNEITASQKQAHVASI